VHPDAVLASGDLGGIGAALDDGGNDDCVAALARSGGDDDTVADVEVGVGGEATVDCYLAWRGLR
jgi:hypothetical protein